jgi:rhodanese-related sulfurtransferase
VQVTILDVRGADEFSGPAGHIPGAFNIPLGELPGKLDLLLRPGAGEIVLVCLTDKRSAAAAKILCAAGWSAIAVLRGGMKRWRELGLATA